MPSADEVPVGGAGLVLFSVVNAFPGRRGQLSLGSVARKRTCVQALAYGQAEGLGEEEMVVCPADADILRLDLRHWCTPARFAEVLHHLMAWESRMGQNRLELVPKRLMLPANYLAIAPSSPSSGSSSEDGIMEGAIVPAPAESERLALVEYCHRHGFTVQGGPSPMCSWLVTVSMGPFWRL